ncbi:MAG: Omp28-related outer membrane protein [Crocinitomicaceae bacterium]
MKKLLFISGITVFSLLSCDKVENPYPDSGPQGDWNELYPNGDSSDYAATEWPTFLDNPNINRNILLEDFTGHKCIFCPAAAELAHQLELDNPGRVIVSAIHTGASGQMEAFQQIAQPYFITDFTNEEAFSIGKKFGNDWPGSPFVGNPFGTISRKDQGNSFPVTQAQQWEASTNSMIAANDLKVNIQAEKNYYPSTRGFFLHTEIDVLDASLTNDLRIVVHLLEDSIVAAQEFPSGTFPEPSPFDKYDLDYVHRDIFRESIDGSTFGQLVDTENLDANGKYYFNYAYKLPDAYNADNVHVIIYVRDAMTEEVYHVIKKKFE